MKYSLFPVKAIFKCWFSYLSKVPFSSMLNNFPFKNILRSILNQTRLLVQFNQTGALLSILLCREQMERKLM